MGRGTTEAVLAALRTRIAAGATALPAERVLADGLGVSRTTVRAALARLACEGSLVRQVGRGTRVVHPPGPQAVHLLYPTSHDIRAGDAYLAELIEAFAHRLGMMGAALALRRIPPGERLTQCLSGGMPSARQGGVIIVGDPEDQAGLADLLDGRVPLVVIADPTAGLAAPVIGGDHGAAVRAAIAHLRALGHRRIALVDGPMTDPYVGHRRAAYLGSMAEVGVAPIEVPTIGWDSQAGAASALALLSLPQPPSAIIAYGDYATVGMVGGLRQRGVVVPRDLSVAVIDHRIWIDRVLGLAMTGWYESPDLVAETALAVLAAQRVGGGAPAGPGSVPFSCRPGASTGPIRPESC